MSKKKIKRSILNGLKTINEAEGFISSGANDISGEDYRVTKEDVHGTTGHKSGKYDITSETGES